MFLIVNLFVGYCTVWKSFVLCQLFNSDIVHVIQKIISKSATCKNCNSPNIEIFQIIAFFILIILPSAQCLNADISPLSLVSCFYHCDPALVRPLCDVWEGGRRGADQIAAPHRAHAAQNRLTRVRHSYSRRYLILSGNI